MVPSKTNTDVVHKMPENLINNGRITKRVNLTEQRELRKKLKTFERLKNISDQRYTVAEELLDQYESLYGVPEKFNQSNIRNFENNSTPGRFRLSSIEQ